MNLRRGVAEDAPAVARLVVEAWRAAYRGIVPDVFLEKLDSGRRAERLRQSFASGSEETHVAEEEGEVAGFVTLGGCRDRGAAPTTGEIWGVYVEPRRWGEGIGTGLVREAERRLVDRGATEAALWVFEGNARARRFYEAAGYALDGARKEIEVGASIPAVRYRKALRTEETGDRGEQAGGRA